MSVKIKDKITSDGKKLERLLKELAEKQLRKMEQTFATLPHGMS